MEGERLRASPEGLGLGMTGPAVLPLTSPRLGLKVPAFGTAEGPQLQIRKTCRVCSTSTRLLLAKKSHSTPKKIQSKISGSSATHSPMVLLASRLADPKVPCGGPGDHQSRPNLFADSAALALRPSHCRSRTLARCSIALWLSHCILLSHVRSPSDCAQQLCSAPPCRSILLSHVMLLSRDSLSLSLARGAASAPLTHVDRISPPSLPVSLPAAGALILSSFFRCLRVSHSPCQHCDCPLLRAQPLVVPCSPSTAPIALSHTLGLYCFLSLSLSLSRCPPPPLA